MSLKYAIIGCGMISPSHITAALNNNLDIVALCDIVESNLKRTLELVPKDKRTSVKLYTDYNLMLSELSPELVAIALGSGLKKNVSIDCMMAGANVIVEKPIALSMAEADEMIEVAKKNDVLLAVNHQLRFGRTVRALKAEVEAGHFGKLVHGAVQVRRNRDKAYYDAAKWRGTWAEDGGTLMNQCIHYTDLLQWIMGSEVIEVFAYTDRMIHPYIEAEDIGLALIKFENGAYGVIEGTVNVYPRNLSDSISLFGEFGAVVLNGKTSDDVQAWDIQNGSNSAEEAFMKYNIKDMGSGHTPLYSNMIDAIKKGTPLLCSGEDGRKALELILAIYKSKKNGLPIQLPLGHFGIVDMKGIFDNE